MALLLNVTEGSIRHHLNKLQEEGFLVHVGPDKGGYWNVKNEKAVIILSGSSATKEFAERIYSK